MDVETNTNKRTFGPKLPIINGRDKNGFYEKTSWEKEFKIQITEQQWLTSYKKAMQISRNMTLQENGVKLHLQ